eukprot:365471-Chlamydomonas_euryale.AAC.15
MVAMQDASTQTCMLIAESDDLRRQVCQLQAQLAESQQQHKTFQEQISAQRYKAEEMEKACGIMRKLHKELARQRAAERVKVKEQEKAVGSRGAPAGGQAQEGLFAELTHKLEREVTARLDDANEINKARNDAEELRGLLAFTQGELDREEKRKPSKAGEWPTLSPTVCGPEEAMPQAGAGAAGGA